jgi:hypothetical protein
MSMKKAYYTVNGALLGEKAAGGQRVDYVTDALGSVTAMLVQTAVVSAYQYKYLLFALFILSLFPCSAYCERAEKLNHASPLQGHDKQKAPNEKRGFLDIAEFSGLDNITEISITAVLVANHIQNYIPTGMGKAVMVDKRQERKARMLVQRDAAKRRYLILFLEPDKKGQKLNFRRSPNVYTEKDWEELSIGLTYKAALEKFKQTSEPELAAVLKSERLAAAAKNFPMVVKVRRLKRPYSNYDAKAKILTTRIGWEVEVSIAPESDPSHLIVFTYQAWDKGKRVEYTGQPESTGQN